LHILDLAILRKGHLLGRLLLLAVADDGSDGGQAQPAPRHAGQRDYDTDPEKPNEEPVSERARPLLSLPPVVQG